MKRFERVKQILEEAVEGKTIMAHGNFWRDLTLEQFKVKKIFGKLLVEVGNAEASNLIKAIEGRAPFGSDIGTPGAVFKRMPDGFPPIPPEKISVIRQWINDGCPDEEEASGGETKAQKLIRYNAYWRDFDNWSLFNRTPEIDDAINEFFPLAEIWMSVALQQTPVLEWENAISTQTASDAVKLLGARILETIRSHYGTPVNFDELLESYELFGSDKLPDDPLRPQDPRHNMNGEIMWFFYSAFWDARRRVDATETEDLAKLGRGILIGLLNDGLFRGRFPVTGFTPDDEGAAAVRTFARTISSDEISDELARRFADSQAVSPMPEDNKIIELMKVPAINHDISWLKEALQSALKLELATLPPYLCAMWSIIETDPNAGFSIASIKTIVVDEMQHMGTVCNMMTTLGFTPAINTSDAVPTYPAHLPGGVNPQLTVSLRKLDDNQLKTFLEIEKPEHPPIMPKVESLGEEFPTIGAFYNAILEAFKKLPASAYKNERQITSGGLSVISDFSKVEEAIGKIKVQGEGTDQSPEEEGPMLAEPDLAHFYRFRELLWKRRFIQNAAGEWINGDEIKMPAIYDMADIPAGGYPESRDFDQIYTELLNSLQKMWETGDNDEFDNAFLSMVTMEGEAKKLMKTFIDPNDHGKGCFGPSFLLITSS
jgi:hypothetical protein